MGSGEFGSNGSVHWRIVPTGGKGRSAYVQGRDPNLPDARPRRTAGTPDFVVTLRFRSKEEAIDALDEARTTVSPAGIVSLHVLPTTPRRKRPVDDLPWEVQVKWTSDLGRTRR